MKEYIKNISATYEVKTKHLKIMIDSNIIIDNILDSDETDDDYWYGFNYNNQIYDINLWYDEDMDYELSLYEGVNGVINYSDNQRIILKIY